MTAMNIAQVNQDDFNGGYACIKTVANSDYSAANAGNL